MSVRAWARSRGISHGAGTRAVAAGRVTLRPDGKVDPRKADRQFADRTRARVDGRLPGAQAAAGRLYRDARTKRETALARLAELQLAERSGRLVDAGEVTQWAFDQARHARNALMAIPARVAGVLAGLVDPAEIERRLKREVEAVCVELAKPRRKEE